MGTLLGLLGGMVCLRYGHSLRPLITDTQLAWVFFRAFLTAQLSNLTIAQTEDNIGRNLHLQNEPGLL